MFFPLGQTAHAGLSGGATLCLAGPPLGWLAQAMHIMWPGVGERFPPPMGSPDALDATSAVVRCDLGHMAGRGHAVVDSLVGGYRTASCTCAFYYSVCLPLLDITEGVDGHLGTTQ